jgi:hypothetical protein
MITTNDKRIGAVVIALLIIIIISILRFAQTSPYVSYSTATELHKQIIEYNLRKNINE